MALRHPSPARRRAGVARVPGVAHLHGVCAAWLPAFDRQHPQDVDGALRVGVGAPGRRPPLDPRGSRLLARLHGLADRHSGLRRGLRRGAPESGPPASSPRPVRFGRPSGGGALSGLLCRSWGPRGDLPADHRGVLRAGLGRLGGGGIHGSAQEARGGRRQGLRRARMARRRRRPRDVALPRLGPPARSATDPSSGRRHGRLPLWRGRFQLDRLPALRRPVHSPPQCGVLCRGGDRRSLRANPGGESSLAAAGDGPAPWRRRSGSGDPGDGRGDTALDPPAALRSPDSGDLRGGDARRPACRRSAPATACRGQESRFHWAGGAPLPERRRELVAFRLLEFCDPRLLSLRARRNGPRRPGA